MKILHKTKTPHRYRARAARGFCCGVGWFGYFCRSTLVRFAILPISIGIWITEPTMRTPARMLSITAGKKNALFSDMCPPGLWSTYSANPMNLRLRPSTRHTLDSYGFSRLSSGKNDIVTVSPLLSQATPMIPAQLSMSRRGSVPLASALINRTSAVWSADSVRRPSSIELSWFF